MTGLQQTYPEHPEDVLAQWLSWQADDKAALIVVTAIEGGAVRAPGALMAVSSSGEIAGYISGGCIDADVALQAVDALKTGKDKQLRYGAGSPFTDLPLPCGGAIEVAILPKPDRAAIEQARNALKARQPATLQLEGMGDFTASYTPKLRLRIAGRGADALALARLARAAGIEAKLQLRDGEDVEAASAQGLGPVTPLETPSDIPQSSDDAWTAFVLMFHDRDWEAPLLRQALDGPAFYIGAVGSRRTHARRCEDLASSGTTAVQLQRINGPIGLIPSMRDASMLAVSVLAEIVAAYHDRIRRPLASTALILLAAGQSKRFEGGDKLMAPLDGVPVLAKSAGLLASQEVASRIAVTGPGDEARADLLKAAGWQVVHNPGAANGQATSLAAGIRAAKADGADAALVLLGDMPKVSETHLLALHREYRLGRTAVMSSAGNILCPPAIFHHSVFEALTQLGGDQGAKALFKSLDTTASVILPDKEAIDIDTRADLTQAEGLAHV